MCDRGLALSVWCVVSGALVVAACVLCARIEVRKGSEEGDTRRFAKGQIFFPGGSRDKLERKFEYGIWVGVRSPCTSTCGDAFSARARSSRPPSKDWDVQMHRK